MEFTDFAKDVADRFPRLSPQLQAAARYVMDRPDDVALMSMRTVATDAGVHPTTLSRLARALDFSSYDDFRVMFQKRLRSHPSDYLGRARELQAREDGRFGRIVGEVCDAAVENITASFSANELDKFAASAKAISEARRVFVVGQRSCYPIAFYFAYVYGVFRSNAQLLDGSGGTFADHLRSMEKGDVIFAVSFEPYTRATVAAVDYAREHGGGAVVLTDNMVSPLVERADHTLVIKNESPSFFQSVAPAMAAVEALIALMVVGDGDDALEAIEESERQLKRFEAYWDRSPRAPSRDSRT